MRLFLNQLDCRFCHSFAACSTLLLANSWVLAEV